MSAPRCAAFQALAGATGNTFVAVFLTGAIGSLLANVVNNQVRGEFQGTLCGV